MRGLVFSYPRRESLDISSLREHDVVVDLTISQAMVRAFAQISLYLHNTSHLGLQPPACNLSTECRLARCAIDSGVPCSPRTNDRRAIAMRCMTSPFFTNAATCLAKLVIA